MFKKNFFTYFLCVLLSISFCYTNAQSNSSGRYTAVFKYEPQNRTSVANSGITICEITPFFDGQNSNGFVPLLQSFKDALENDLEILLIAKGYKVRGPFKTRDEMVFEDKKQADFTLEVSILWDAKFTRSLKKIFGPGQFKTKKGELDISRGIQLTAISNFSGEKLWKKRIALDPQTLTWKGTHDLGKDAADVPFWDEYKKEESLSEILGKAMEVTYKECLDFLWKQFDLNEVTSIVEQAKLERSSQKQKKDN